MEEGGFVDFEGLRGCLRLASWRYRLLPLAGEIHNVTRLTAEYDNDQFGFGLVWSIRSELCLPVKYLGRLIAVADLETSNTTVPETCPGTPRDSS